MKAGFVALVGRPNVGKSTLLNRLVGTKIAIVSDKPQTTRSRIVGVLTTPAAQIIFVDTPGIHQPRHRLNVRMVDAAIESLRQADLIAVVLDASVRPGRGDHAVLELAREARATVVLILNKIDLIEKPILLPLIDSLRSEQTVREIVPVSARTGESADRLERVLVDELPDGEPLYPPDYLTDQPERVLVAETVREKVLQHTHAELPFSTAVLVDRFEEPDARGLMRLYCTILAEKPSQKPILVGRGGEMVKRIGMAARDDLERFFGTRVFLDLRVKVRPEWREDDTVLDALGVGRRRG